MRMENRLSCIRKRREEKSGTTTAASLSTSWPNLRIYDRGKSEYLDPKERLRMPKPYLTDEWRTSLTTLLLGSLGRKARMCRRRSSTIRRIRGARTFRTAGG